MEKKFKPFDKVLYKSERDKKWHCRYYDQWDEESQLHLLTDDSKILDSNILPYEGNEHLVGTDLPADEEVRLEEGEIFVFSDAINEFLNFGIIGKLVEKKRGLFCYEVGRDWNYAIRFSDFNPNDMEETKKHILCVKGGKVVKYKG